MVVVDRSSEPVILRVAAVYGIITAAAAALWHRPLVGRGGIERPMPRVVARFSPPR